MRCEVCSETYDTINKLLEHMKARHGRAKPWFLQPSDTVDGQTDLTAAPPSPQGADSWSTCGDVDREELDTHESKESAEYDTDQDSWSEEGEVAIEYR